MITLQLAEQPWTLSQWQRLGQQALYWLAMVIISCSAAGCLGLWCLHRGLLRYRYVTRILNQTTASQTLDTELQSTAEQAAQHIQAEYAQAQQALQKLRELDHA